MPRSDKVAGMDEHDHTAENEAGALLARLAANPAAIERIHGTLQRIGRPADHSQIHGALLAASADVASDAPRGDAG